jgi:hypothetical protein
MESAEPTLVWVVTRSYIEADSREDAMDILDALQAEHDFLCDETITEDQSSGLDSTYETIELAETEITDRIKKFLADKQEAVTKINTESESE